MEYVDRFDAALKLIPYIQKYEKEQVIILAIPRGGVPVAYVLAKAFGFPMELLMTKKIGHPCNPEFAIGAVSLEDVIIDQDQIVSHEYLERAIKLIRSDLKKRYELLVGNHVPVSFAEKTLLIVDDGIATGNTILSAIGMLRRKNPKKIVVAVPVAPRSTVEKLRSEVDEVICPYTPANFYGVGYHYEDFSQVTDGKVIEMFREIENINKVI